MAVSIDDLLGDVPLASHGVDRDRRVFELQHLQEFPDGGDHQDVVKCVGDLSGPTRTGQLQYSCSDMWRPYLKVIAKKAFSQNRKSPTDSFDEAFFVMCHSLSHFLLIEVNAFHFGPAFGSG